jgi:hypothetical protein
VKRIKGIIKKVLYSMGIGVYNIISSHRHHMSEVLDHLDGPQLYEIVQWMKDHGFVAYDLFGGQNRPLDGALAQMDLVFVKEKGFLRKYHHYATREQREKHTQLVSVANPK